MRPQNMSPADLARVLADPVQASEAFGDSPQSWQMFAAEYANSSPLIRSQIEAAEQAAVGEFMRQHPVSGGGYSPVVAGEASGRDGSGRNRLYNKRGAGAALDHLFAGTPANELLGTFVQHAVAEPGTDDIQAKMRAAQFGNAMSERVPSSGGFLVPEVLRSDIQLASLERAVVRPRARIIPMDSLRIPFPVIDDTSHASSVFGGVTANWTEEGAVMPVSQPSFGRLVLEAKKLTVYTTVPNELLSDAPGLSEFLGSLIPGAIAFFEDVAFLTGSGAGQPQGILNAPGAVKVSRGSAGKVIFADVVSMYARLLPQSFTSASTCWVCSPDVLPQLLQMATIDVKNATALAPPTWLRDMSAAGERPTSILGFPLYVSEKLPGLGTVGDLVLADWSFYLLGQRQELSFAMSEEFLFSQDLSAFRWIERIDGRLWIQSPVAQQGGSANSLSPAIILQ